MPHTPVSIRVHGPLGSAELEALADTGSTFTKVPRSATERVGVDTAYETTVELGDGRTVVRQLALADVEISGVRRPVLVTVGENGDQPLVGYTTLESLGFKVNPVTHSLEPTPATEY
ncbi:MAG: aspartyl protease family protein [Chloroflexi bacterium]|nr:aspartyl protease family protein [Chloroflexota bacterium]